MIHAEGLTRQFRVKKTTVEAVRGIDLHIEAGELVALLGPNGAGKSTLLRMLTTLLPPTSGRMSVAGHDVLTDPAGVRTAIGYVGQKNSAGENFLVRDELVTQARTYGLPKAQARQRADEALRLLDLQPLAARKPATLSGGQRRRVDVAMCLLHRPRLLFLDEPSTGLDPQSRANLWEHILRLREQHGMTLFLTTHYLEEADRMAERVLIIDRGRIIADGTAEGLKRELAGDQVVISVVDPAEVATAAAIAERIPEAVAVETDATTVRLRVPRANTVLPEYLRALDTAGIKAITAESRQSTLDDVFLALAGHSLREGHNADQL
ncbi:ATP-binding cassette domain-containing protein [Amycolatopsis taiwanensis]|uniref:ATP-binding cassette domain-containing protein n=1 Tax=Amycolatopsis taiwanensis TaxID=342230 RepID=UPI0004817A09|nr:ATP-binding cassette domain-containing protein [Amycolatopsis taiwanensis]